MIRILLIVFSVFILLSGCASSSLYSSSISDKKNNLIEKLNPPESFTSRDLKIVAIGDSLTAGVGDESKQGGYIGMVKKMLERETGLKEVTLSNFGIRGHKTDDLLKKLSNEEVISRVKEADIIVMTIGANDIMEVVRGNILSLDFEPFRNEKKNYEDRFSDILSTIRKHNTEAQIVYVGLYNPFKLMLPELTEIDIIIEEWNNSSQRLIQADPNSNYVPVDDFFSRESVDKLLYKDEFHPNKLGYSLMADRVFNAIKNEEINYLSSE
ncbi:SGNH/GDSL hydrolase family protein [Metabacillus herbersteinensis]|uniref:SGNH/GDSL hydrolase family protein n=1 Tax=Metabacillus herbersteinensis TaxID=283816 RepID=A0ABV6GNA2_9BACI